jgi:hypothetical protein
VHNHYGPSHQLQLCLNQTVLNAPPSRWEPNHRQYRMTAYRVVFQYHTKLNTLPGRVIICPCKGPAFWRGNSKTLRHVLS